MIILNAKENGQGTDTESAKKEVLWQEELR